MILREAGRHDGFILEQLEHRDEDPTKEVVAQPAPRLLFVYSVGIVFLFIWDYLVNIVVSIASSPPRFTLIIALCGEV